jgi:SIR2-like domain
MDSDLPEPFADLAQHMAANHVYLSVRNEDYATASQHFLKESPNPPPKIVVVVGAGASNDACGLPTGQVAATRLIEAFEKKARVSEGLIRDEIHRITVEYRLGREDFEAVLLALSKFDQKTVLDELNAVYSRRDHPSLTYEVLAHWLKHRFIDAVVNFNFDELLDQAVDDELGADGYRRIVTDGDCPEDLENWLDSRGRFRFPLYIKPHGTASHKSTMRFTRSSYSLLPPDLERLLLALFRNQVDVVIMGHAMQSVEFNDILARSGDKNLRFYAVCKKKPKLRAVANNKKWDLAFWPTKTSGGLGVCVDGIATKVAYLFKDRLKPRSIERHRLISKLFQRAAVLDEEEGSRGRQLRAYLRDRVYVEIALAISKAKGFVSLEHLTRGRAGQYFRQLRRIAPGGEPLDSMLLMCTNLGLEQFGYSQDTLCLPVKAKRDRLQYPILTEDEFTQAAHQLATRTTDLLNPERQSRCSGSELRQALMEMYLGEEVEVSSDTYALTNDLFANSTALTTFTALHAQTRKMIESLSWDAVLCTAESGQWLTCEEWSGVIKARRARLAVVLADLTHADKLRSCFGDQLLRVRWLPWWLHNRHVTVLLKGTEVVGAVFFERRLRSMHIAPLWLEGPDAVVAKDSFVAYWIKAAQYAKQNEIEIPAERVQTEWAKLTDDLSARGRAKRAAG